VPNLVGVYDNPAGVEPLHVVISEDGLYLVGRGGTNLVRYSELREVDPPRDKEEHGPGVLNLVYRDGRNSTLWIGGRDGKFRDVYPFAHFLARVISVFDVTSEGPGGNAEHERTSRARR
jgi:hypothetical protein